MSVAKLPTPPDAGRLETWARRLFVLAAVVLVPAITFLITADAVMRYAFERSISWAQDGAGLALFALFCAGLPYSWYGQFHVRMDLLYDRTPRAFRLAVDVIATVAAVVTAGTLAAYAAQAVPAAYNNQTTMPIMQMPIWPIVLFGAICCALFCLAMVAWIVERVMRTRAA